MGKKNIAGDVDIVEALQERIYVYLQQQGYNDQAYKVMIFSLEYLEESKRLVSNEREKARFVRAAQITKDIIRQLEKRKLPIVQKLSLLFIEINPCLIFSVGIKFRKILERFL